jgi:outer membrane protein assembly factor BamB
MVALDLPTGQRVWERNFAGVSTPWVAGDWVFALTVDGQLVALSRSEGRVRWVTQLPQFRKMKSKRGDIRWFGPVLASDRLWVTASTGLLAWVDPQTGEVGGQIDLDDEIYLPPVVADGAIFVLTDKGRLTALR